MVKVGGSSVGCTDCCSMLIAGGVWKLNLVQVDCGGWKTFSTKQGNHIRYNGCMEVVWVYERVCRGGLIAKRGRSCLYHVYVNMLAERALTQYIVWNTEKQLGKKHAHHLKGCTVRHTCFVKQLSRVLCKLMRRRLFFTVTFLLLLKHFWIRVLWFVYYFGNGSVLKYWS